MNKKIISFAVVATLFSVSSFAAMNTYLNIKGSKGSSQVISCPNGACTVPTLAADTYSVTVVDEKGNASSLDAACTVVTAREASSGMATGKRMHKPFTITKEMRTGELVVGQDDAGLAITCSSSGAAATEATAVKPTYDVKSATK